VILTRLTGKETYSFAPHRRRGGAIHYRHAVSGSHYSTLLFASTKLENIKSNAEAVRESTYSPRRDQVRRTRGGQSLVRVRGPRPLAVI
jgi:hypothetical protein